MTSADADNAKRNKHDPARRRVMLFFPSTVGGRRRPPYPRALAFNRAA